MTVLQTPSYTDLIWDTMEHVERERLSLMQAKQTVLFAKQYVPFYRRHYASLSNQDIEAISCLDEFATVVPEITKAHLARNHYRVFMPDGGFRQERDASKGAYRNKSTGGTTGRPVTIIYTPQDWRAMAQHIARSIKFDFRNSIEELHSLVVCGLYHGDHVTNEVYQAGMSLLGMEFFNRVSTKAQDIESTYQFIQRAKPNALLAPPEDPSAAQSKGITLDKILKLDAENSRRGAFRLGRKNNTVFRAVFWSSMPMSPDMYEYLRFHLQIPYIQGQYGSTEVCPTGATCELHPTDFHLGYGPTLVLVCASSPAKRLVREHEEGYLLVTKCGATDSSGRNTVPSGSTLINFRTGDYATLVNTDGQQCACGRNTPVLVGIRRQEYRLAKIVGGCQAD